MNRKKIIFALSIFCLAMVPILAMEGTVVSVTGKVEVESPSGWKALKEGDIVNSGLVISTGFRSKAVLKVAGSLITVDPLTRLTLEQLSESGDAHSTEVFLDLGTIGANVKTAENKRVNFRVNTPVATASVRGTAFRMGLDSLKVTEGTVSFVARKNIKFTDSSAEEKDSSDEPHGKEIAVRKGNSSTVTSSGTASNPTANRVSQSLGVKTAPTETVIPYSPSSFATGAVKPEVTPPTVAPTTADVTVTFGY